MRRQTAYTPPSRREVAERRNGRGDSPLGGPPIHPGGLTQITRLNSRSSERRY